jgi:hypothetical protein
VILASKHPGAAVSAGLDLSKSDPWSCSRCIARLPFKVAPPALREAGLSHPRRGLPTPQKHPSQPTDEEDGEQSDYKPQHTLAFRVPRYREVATHSLQLTWTANVPSDQLMLPMLDCSRTIFLSFRARNNMLVAADTISQ